MLLADREISPGVASAATCRKQARIIFDNMVYAIEANPKLKAACHVIDSKSSIKTPKSNGRYESLSVEAKSSLGPSYSCVILDEYAFHRTDALAAALKPTMAAREQPLLLAITTAGTDFTGPGFDMYAYACKVRDGVSLDTSFFAAIYEADEGCQVDDEKQWHKANPSLIHGTLSVAELRDASTAAKHSKAEEIQFRYYRQNRWTKGLTSFLSVDRWDACRGNFPEALKGQPIYLGADFASSKDLVGLCGIIPFNGLYYVLHHAWAPRAAADRRVTENRTRYELFQAEGSLTISDGNGTDYRQVREYIRQLAKQYEVKEIVADPNYANETLMELMDDGFTVFRFAQSPRNYTDPTRRFESLVLDRKIVHDGSDIMRWQIQNLQVEVTGDDFIRPAKGKSSDKIDSVCALIMGLSRAVCHDQVYRPQVSVYDTQPIMIL